MKKLIIVALLGISLASAVFADTFCTDWGKANLCLPIAKGVDTAYGYDFKGNQSQGLAETPIGVWHVQQDATLNLKFGGVISEFDRGSPFIGLDYAFTNPISAFANINPGIYGGKNWVDGSYFWGLKASIQIIAPK